MLYGTLGRNLSAVNGTNNASGMNTMPSRMSVNLSRMNSLGANSGAGLPNGARQMTPPTGASPIVNGASFPALPQSTAAPLAAVSVDSFPESSSIDSRGTADEYNNRHFENLNPSIGPNETRGLLDTDL